MNLDFWAQRWAIPRGALMDLQNMMQGVGAEAQLDLAGGKSEAAVQNLVRLEASEKGLRLWRNNVGATYTKEGSFIRYGLANDSSAVNKVIKSADLIGVRPIKITHEMVGTTLGQFVSREIKAAGWEFKGTVREEAQMRWAELLTSMGADASFATGKGTL